MVDATVNDAPDMLRPATMGIAPILAVNDPDCVVVSKVPVSLPVVDVEPKVIWASALTSTFIAQVAFTAQVAVIPRVGEVMASPLIGAKLLPTTVIAIFRSPFVMVYEPDALASGITKSFAGVHDPLGAVAVTVNE